MLCRCPIKIIIIIDSFFIGVIELYWMLDTKFKLTTYWKRVIHVFFKDNTFWTHLPVIEGSLERNSEGLVSGSSAIPIAAISS